MQDLRITLVQTDLLWQDKPANLLKIDQLINGVQTDVVVLPEMFATGFSMDAKNNFSEMEGREHLWMKAKAKELNAVVSGSLIIKENGSFYNRFLWVQPDGTTEFYDKRHLFRMANEQEHYAPGKNIKVLELKGWKIALQVCYDLRFPVWSRNKNLGYDTIIYVANWPEKRSFAWKNLLKARAIENLAYCIGVNRVGLDGNGINYSGDSAALSYLGEELSNIPPNQEKIETVLLSKASLDEYRKKFPAWMDADDFTLGF